MDGDPHGSERVLNGAGALDVVGNSCQERPRPAAGRGTGRRLARARSPSARPGSAARTGRRSPSARPGSAARTGRRSPSARPVRAARAGLHPTGPAPLATFHVHAAVAKLVDAHGSGPCGGNPLEVQVLSAASGQGAPGSARAGRSERFSPRRAPGAPSGSAHTGRTGRARSEPALLLGHPHRLGPVARVEFLHRR